MSLWGRLGPGVQGLPVLFIATAESNLCPMDAPQSLDRDHLGGPGSPLTISWKDCGGGGLGVWLVGRAPTAGAVLPRTTPCCFCSRG